jgi:hypothetical protein
MKTISEYQPLLFSTLQRVAEQRERRREKVLRAARWATPVVYALVAMKVTADTALVPWDIGFWLIVAPIIAISEYAIRCWESE